MGQLKSRLECDACFGHRKQIKKLLSIIKSIRETLNLN